jgi:hypothetical protein
MERRHGECPLNYGKGFVDFKSFLKEDLSYIRETIREKNSEYSEKNILKFQEGASKSRYVVYAY